MTQIPYATPPQGQQYDLPSIAKYQRIVNICILVYILAIVLTFVLPPDFRVISALMLLGAGLAGLVFVILLASKLYSTGTAILYGIGTIIPLIGLIVLLVVNSKASNVLKANGYKIGLLGAK